MSKSQTRKKATKKPRKKEYHHGDLYRALVGAARSILEKEGVEKLSLRAASRLAGVSQAAPYHHFKDKNDLLAAVAAEGFQEFGEALAKAAEAQDDPEKAHRVSGVAYVDFAVSNPALFRLMFGALGGNVKSAAGASNELNEAAGGAYHSLEERAAAAAGEKATPDATSVQALKDWCIVHGLSSLYIDGRLDPTKYGAKNMHELASRVLAIPPSQTA